MVNLTDPTSTVGSPYHSAKLNFAPRFGFAWDPTGGGKTSIRGGVGTYYNEVNIKEAGTPADYRFAANYTLTCVWSGPGAATNPCAQFPLLPSNPLQFFSTAKSETMVQNHLATPTVIQYGLDLQRQLTNSMSLRVGYVGWKGYNLTATVEENDLIANPATGLFIGGTKPNANFGTIAELAGVAKANYNGLQTEFKKALSAGLMFQVSYTYSHTLSDADSSSNRVTDNSSTGYVVLNPLNVAQDYGRSVYDQRHLLVTNAQYTLPFDRRLKGGLEKALLGGWVLNGIWQYGSGLPLNVTDGFNESKNGDPVFPDRPNLNPGFSNDPTSGVTAGCAGVAAGQQLGTPNLWFDPCAFSLNPAGTFGNLGKNTLSGPNYDQTNVTLAKVFAFNERTKLQFRAEFFNVFNHAQFGTPSLPLFNSNGTRSGTAGDISLTSGAIAGIGGRQIQLGLKLTF